MKAITNSTLILWLSIFIAGMLVSRSEMYGYCVLVALFSFLLGAVSFGCLKPFNNYLTVAPLFFLLGFVLMEREFPTENKELGKGDNYYVGTIERQLNVGETWTTNLVRLHAGLDKYQQWKVTGEKIVLLTENKETLLRQNDIFLFRSALNEISFSNNPGAFDARMYWLSKGVRYQGFGASEQIKLLEHVPLGWFDQVLEHVREYSTKMLDKWVGEDDAPLIKAILLGDKSDLDIDTKRVFTNTGAMHMLAVSGMHVGLIVVLLSRIFKHLFFHRGRLIALWLMLVLLWFYAFLTGFSASVSRAVVMFSVLVFAQLMKRGYQPINGLAIAAFFIVLWDPLSLFDIGFQLSFLAMVGIFTVYPLLEKAFVFRYKWMMSAWQGTAIGLASQVFTVPISVFYFNQFPNYFILTNVGVMLFSGMMLGLAIGVLSLGEIAVVSAPIGWILAICCTLLVGFIETIELLPGALSVGFTPSWIWVVVMYGFLAVALYWIQLKRWLLICVFLVPLVIWLQLNRFSNLYTKEWIVFNSNFPVVLFNTGNNQLCFYSHSEKGLEKVKRLASDYQKLHPGKIDFIPLSKNKQIIQFGGKTFSILRKNGWIEVLVEQKKYAILTSYIQKLDDFAPDTQIISMRHDSESSVHNLSEGPFRVKL